MKGVAHAAAAQRCCFMPRAHPTKQCTKKNVAMLHMETGIAMKRVVEHTRHQLHVRVLGAHPNPEPLARTCSNMRTPARTRTLHPPHHTHTTVTPTSNSTAGAWSYIHAYRVHRCVLTGRILFMESLNHSRRIIATAKVARCHA